MQRFVLALAAVVVLCAGAARADELSDRVRNLYKPYEVEDGTPPDITDVLKRNASKRLRDLLAKDEACQKRTQSVCGFGHDPIVNGQDYKVEKVQVGPADIQGDKASVTARFLNFGTRSENRFEFVQEGGAWKLADIVTVLPKNVAGRLTEALAPQRRRRR